MTVFDVKDLSHEDAGKLGFGQQYNEDRPVGVFVRGKISSGTKAQWAEDETSLVAIYRMANDGLHAVAGPNMDRLARLQHARRERISAGIARLTGEDQRLALQRLQSLGEPPPLRI